MLRTFVTLSGVHGLSATPPELGVNFLWKWNEQGLTGELGVSCEFSFSSPQTLVQRCDGQKGGMLGAHGL